MMAPRVMDAHLEAIIESYGLDPVVIQYILDQYDEIQRLTGINEALSQSNKSLQGTEQ